MADQGVVVPSGSPPLRPLTTSRLVLAPVQDEDAGWLQSMMERPEVNGTTLVIPTPCPAGFAQGWLETARRNLRSGQSYTFAARRDQEPIGTIFLVLNPAHAHAELGYFFAPAHWNKGFGSEASAEMLRFAFHDLRLHRVFAVYLAGNPASGRIMQKIGMRYEGCRRQHVRKCGVFHDLEQYGILRDEWLRQAGRREG
jgi:RimJ/RimL family protein N-acetyltransferase